MLRGNAGSGILKTSDGVFSIGKGLSVERKHGLMSITVLFLIGHKGGFARESLMNQTFVLSLVNQDSAQHAEASDNSELFSCKVGVRPSVHHLS